MKNNNNEIFEKNIEKLMKLTENNDQPNQVFVEKLIDDAMVKLAAPQQNRKLNTRRSTMKVTFKRTAAIAAALLVAAGIYTVVKTGIFGKSQEVHIGPVANNTKTAESQLAPIPLEIPPALFVGTPTNLKVRNLEKPTGKPRPPFYAPVGTKNIALNKPVTSTDDMPIIGDIPQITDGDKQAKDGSWLELGPLDQHITIDLDDRYNIYAIVAWHYHKNPRVYYDVVVQVADDPDFIKNVVTLFNNDDDNSLGLGVGKDKHYIETNEGKLIDTKGVQARYVRLYSSGNNANDMNHYVEVEVYGKPVSKGSAPTPTTKQSSLNENSVKPIPLELPAPGYIGTPVNVKIDKLEEYKRTPRPPFYAPVGTTNVALNKTVKSTDDMPIIGEIPQITDGDKEASDGSWVELGPFDQHITIDLGEKHNIYAILAWHYHKEARAYKDVVVMAADDPDFISNVVTLFNNDHDNSLGLGVGKDLHYIESNEGKLIDAKGVQARYVRLYSNGSTANDMNHYAEVEVYGKPLENLKPIPLEIPKPNFTD